MCNAGGCRFAAQRNRTLFAATWLLLALAVGQSLGGPPSGGAEDDRLKPGLQPWRRHTIDASSRGADGARLHDANGDGLLDIATGWEEGGVVRVYLNPGPQKVRESWPAVTVGKVQSPEDAVLVDLDRDGAADVVSSCEGKTRTMFVHWAPRDPAKYLDPTAWRTEPIPATEKQHQWMFALPLDVDNHNGVDLIAGSKSGALGWLESPADTRELSAWKYHQLYKAGWIMSLKARDMNGDGRLDVLVSDRKGKQRGILWLEHPESSHHAPRDESRSGKTPSTPKRPPLAEREGYFGPWPEHRVGDDLGEVMFLDTADLDGNGRLDVVAAVKPYSIALLLQSGEPGKPLQWTTHKVDFSDAFGRAKGVKAADIDGDGRLDLAVSCEGAEGPRSGVFWMSYRTRLTDADWEEHDIGGPEGVKFDRIEMIDLDADGDRDLITCEERDNLGVVWYENPAK